MYGDLQGIAGKTLLEIQGLEMRLLNPPSQDLEGMWTAEKDEDKENSYR